MSRSVMSSSSAEDSTGSSTCCPPPRHRGPATRCVVRCAPPEEPAVATSVDNLRTLPLFARLSDADLQFLATKMDEISVPAGSALITEGMGNHAFFVPADGEVDVLVGGTHRRTLGPH